MTSTLALIGELSEAWARWLLPAFISVTLSLILADLAAWLGRRASPVLRVWIWRGALLKVSLALLLPAAIAVPIPAGFPVSSTALALTGSTAEIVNSGELAADPTWTSVVTITLFLVWTGCVGAHLVRLIRQARVAHRLRSSVTPLDPDAVLDELRSQLSTSRFPQVGRSARVGSPLLIGLARPLIVLPRHAELSGSPLRMAIAHELAHARHRDLIWNLVAALARALWFAHPLVHRACARLDEQQEIRADSWAIRTTRSSVPSYAELLLDVSTSASSLLSLTGIPMASSGASLERRLRALFARPDSRRTPLVLAGFAAAFAFIPFETRSAESTSTVWSATGSEPETHPIHICLRRNGRSIVVRVEDQSPGHTIVTVQHQEGPRKRHVLARLHELREVDDHAYAVLRECVPSLFPDSTVREPAS